MIFCFVFGEKTKQVVQTWPRNNPRKSFFWTRKENWKLSDIFPEFRPKSSSRVSKKAIQMSRGASLGITFFAEMFFFSIVYVLGAENSHIPGGFFQQFSHISLNAVKKTFELNPFLEKVSVFILKVLGKMNELLFLSFCRQFIALGPNCNLQVQKKTLGKKIFWNENSILSKKSKCSPTYSLGLSEQDSTLPEEQFEEKDYFWQNFYVTKLSPALKGEVIYFWPKIEAGCPNMTE